MGYEKINLNAGYNMIGVQFTQIGGDALALPEVGILDSTMAGFDEDGVYDTEMRVWNGVGYDYYGWSGTSAGEYMDDESLNNKWLNLDFEEEVDAARNAGSGFWIKAGSSGNITISGQVPEAETVETPLTSGYNLVANPYPANVAISDFGTLDGSFSGFDEDGNYAVEMRVWNGIGYDYYGWSGTSAGKYMDDESLNNKWLNLDFESVSDPIPYGHGVWIKTSQSGTITFTNPSSSN